MLPRASFASRRRTFSVSSIGLGARLDLGLGAQLVADVGGPLAGGALPVRDRLRSGSGSATMTQRRSPGCGRGQHRREGSHRRRPGRAASPWRRSSSTRRGCSAARPGPPRTARPSPTARRRSRRGRCAWAVRASMIPARSPGAKPVRQAAASSGQVSQVDAGHPHPAAQLRLDLVGQGGTGPGRGRRGRRRTPWPSRPSRPSGTTRVTNASVRTLARVRWACSSSLTARATAGASAAVPGDPLVAFGAVLGDGAHQEQDLVDQLGPGRRGRAARPARRRSRARSSSSLRPMPGWIRRRSPPRSGWGGPG